MTINGGGINPLLQLHPKNFKSLLGKVRRGSFNPFDLTAEMPRFARHDNHWRREKSPPPTPPEEDFKTLGKSWKGGVALVPMLGDPSQKAFGTTLCVGWEGDETLFNHLRRTKFTRTKITDFLAEDSRLKDKSNIIINEELNMKISL